MKTSKTVNPHRGPAGFGAEIRRFGSLRFPSALASLFMLVIGGAFVLSGCPSPTGGGGGSGGIDFRVEPVTPSGKNTESLTITFDSEINTLTQADIDLSLSPSGDVTWGLPLGGGKDWSLIIMFPEASYAGDYNCTVRIGKPGISATARNVTVQNNEGKINFSLTAEVESDGTGVLNIAFSRDTSLKINDITITPTGSSPGNAEIPATAVLSGSGREYSVPINNVRDGSVAVTINDRSSVTSDSTSVTSEARTVELRVGESTGPGPQITSLAIVDIKGEPFTEGKAEVEMGLTLQLYVKTIPMSAKDKVRLTWSSNAESKATVSSKGLVTGVDETGTGSNVIITATSVDSPGVHAYLTLAVKPHTKPTGLSIYDGKLGDGGNYENIIVTENSASGSDYKLELDAGGKPVTFITVLNDASKKPTADQAIFMEYNSGSNSYFEISAPRDRSDGERGKEYTITPKAEGTAIITFTADFYPEVRKTLEVVVKNNS